MKKVLKFCHDYQNPPGSTREHCTYLHTIKEEENLFFATGQLPRVLAERHINMLVIAPETTKTIVGTTPETQIALRIQVTLVRQSPPAPALESAPPLPAPVPLLAGAPLTRQTPNMLPIHNNLLPPPPPPTVPSTVATTTAQLRGPAFTAPSHQNNTVYAEAELPPTVLHRFDASRPPPPLPAHAQTKNGSRKRASSNQSDAPHNKIKKTEERIDADAHCEQCAQGEIRVESLRDKIKRLQRDEENEALALKQMLLQYQNKKNLLKTLVNEDLYNLIDEYIEKSVSDSEVHDVLAQHNQSCTTLPGMSAVPKQFLLQLLDYLSGDCNFKSVPSSTMRLDETLTALRHTNTAPVNKSGVLQAFLDILKQSKAKPEQGSASNFTSDMCNHVAHNSNTNGCHQLTNEMKQNTPMHMTAPPPTYQYAGAPPHPPPPQPPPRANYFPPYHPTPSVSMPPPPPAPPSAPPPAPPSAPSSAQPSAPLSAYPSYHAGPSSYASEFYRQQQ